MPFHYFLCTLFVLYRDKIIKENTKKYPEGYGNNIVAKRTSGLINNNYNSPFLVRHYFITRIRN